jgi:hypothetical protein
MIFFSLANVRTTPKSIGNSGPAAMPSYANVRIIFTHLKTDEGDRFLIPLRRVLYLYA